jgi:hypothetical protein
MDIVYVGVIVVFFLAGIGLVFAFDRLHKV